MSRGLKKSVFLSGSGLSVFEGSFFKKVRTIRIVWARINEGFFKSAISILR